MNIKKPKKIKFKKFKDNPKKYYLISPLKTSSTFNLIFFGTDLVSAFGIGLVFSFGVDFIFGLSFLNKLKKSSLVFNDLNIERFCSLIKFDDVFNGLEAQSKTPTSNIRDFLNKANHSSMLRVFKKFEVSNDLNIERFCSLISLTISTFSPKIKINNPIATIGTKIPAHTKDFLVTLDPAGVWPVLHPE
jgi:hypothetical protein